MINQSYEDYKFVDIYSYWKLLYTFKLDLDQKVLHRVLTNTQIGSNQKVAIKEKCSHFQIKKSYLHIIMLFLQKSKVVRQRELVAHGFMQRPSNIPSWYAWELCSYIQIFAHQLYLIKLDLYVPWGLRVLNPKWKIAIFNYALTWDSQVDCGTTE